MKIDLHIDHATTDQEVADLLEEAASQIRGGNTSGYPRSSSAIGHWSIGEDEPRGTQRRDANGAPIFHFSVGFDVHAPKGDLTPEGARRDLLKSLPEKGDYLSDREVILGDVTIERSPA